jgi:hypothetical protein
MIKMAEMIVPWLFIFPFRELLEAEGASLWPSCGGD